MSTKRKAVTSTAKPAVTSTTKAKPTRGTQRVTAAVDEPAFTPRTKVVQHVHIPDGTDLEALAALITARMQSALLPVVDSEPTADKKVAPTEKKAAPIDTEIRDLDSEIDLLHTALGRLEDNLEPLLAYEQAPVVDDDAPGRNCVSPLHSRLIDLNYRLRLVTARINHLDGRVRT